MKKQFDSGIFHFDEPFVVSGESVVFKGVGANETTLVFHDCPGFDLTMPDGATPIIKDMTIKTNRAGAFDAVKLKCTDASHYYGTGPQFSGLCVTGENVAANFWRRAFDITNGWWSTFHNVSCYGCVNDHFAALTGIILRGNSVGVTMDKVNTFFIGDGIEVVDACEGLSINLSHLVGVRTGIYWHTPIGEPGLNVSQSHFDCSLFGIYSVNLIQSNITNANLFYLKENLYDPVGVWLKNGSEHRVEGNTFMVLAPGGRTSYGIIGNNISNYKIREEENLFGSYVNNRVLFF